MELPDYCTWVSLGVQGTKEDFASDMKRAFKDETEPFVWMMEDTFIRRLDREKFNLCVSLAGAKNIGRVSLTENSHRFYTEYLKIDGSYIFRSSEGLFSIWTTPRDSDYRLSLQPAIWRPEYLFKHLIPGMSPWQFENQNGTLMTFSEEDYFNVKLETSPLISNEGIRRHDLYRYDFTGFSEEDIIHLKAMGYVNNPWSR